MRQTRTRKIVVQLGLCTLLGATLLLAVAVRDRRIDRIAPRPGVARPVGPASLKLLAALPGGWNLQPQPDGVLAVEPAQPDAQPREIRIRCLPLRTLVSPLQYLWRSGQLTTPDAERPPDQPLQILPWRIGDWPAVLAIQKSASRREAHPSERLRTYAAATVLPSRRVICVRLDGRGPDDAWDLDILRQVTDAVRTDHLDMPAVAAGEHALGGGVSVDVPPGWLASPSDDRGRYGLTLVRATNRGWLAVDLVPCLVLPDDGEASVAAMLAVRDPRRPPPIKVTVPIAGRAVAELPVIGSQSAAFASVIYAPHGGGLLAEFHGDIGAAEAIPQAWSQLAAGVHLQPPVNLTARLDAGMRAVRRLCDDPSAALDQCVGESRWLWWRDVPATRLGEVRFVWQSPVDGPEGTATLALDEPGEPRVDAQHEIALAASLTSYHVQAAQLSPASGTTLVRDVSLQRGVLRVVQTRDGDVAGDQSTRVTGRFVPAPLLPPVLASLDDEPAILQTDSLLSAPHACLPGPITLLAQRSYDELRRESGSDHPLKCVQLIVSGTGEIARWHFNDDGDLRYIDLPAGLHIKREE